MLPEMFHPMNKGVWLAFVTVDDEVAERGQYGYAQRDLQFLLTHDDDGHGWNDESEYVKI